jgi:uncharacterized protein
MIRRKIRAGLLAALLCCPLPLVAGEVADAVKRAGQLQNRMQFAESLAVLEPFAANPTGDVAFTLAFAHFNLAIDGRQPDKVDLGRIQTALEWAERARALDNPAGTNLLYIIHGNGFGVPADMPKALEFLKEAAEHGDPGARANYAVMAYRGSPGVTRDRDLAAKYFLELAGRDQPMPIALYYLGLMKFKGEAGQVKDEQAAMKFIRAAAEADLGEAQQDVGRSLEYGWTGKANLRKALPWYEKAAAKGEPWSLWRVGMMYVNGEGRKANSTRALEYFRKSADAGSPEGLTSLAVMYASGDGVQQDFIEARRLYEQAADAGSDHALVNLAGMYLRGEGVDPDTVQAYVLASIAEQRGSERAASLRRDMEAELTAEQLAEAKRRIQE